MAPRIAAHLSNFAINASLASGALIITLLVLEFVLFRFVLRPADLPRIAFENGIVKHAPNQHGINRIRNEIEASWRVNANGWPSAIEHYNEEKAAGTYRIAVIGDSFIEGLVVEPEENMAERLQENLGRSSVEVYRFGISGAPMSQYLHMLRGEVCRYSPDLVLVNVVHNDFSESYKFKQGVYTSSFLKLKIENGRVVQEIAPKPYVEPWYARIRETSAIWRYLKNRQGLQFQVLRDVILGTESTNADPQAGADYLDDLVATQYVLTQLQLKAAECGAELVVVMDGDRDAIYAGQPEPSSHLNAIVKSVTQEQGIRLVDLHEVFFSDYLKHHEMLTFKTDPHWNKRGHAIAARAITKLLNGTAP